MPPPPPPGKPGKKDVQVVRALFDYTAQRDDELTFKEGTILYVLSKDDPNWWKCRADDKEGFVPSNYVGENSAVIDNPLHEASKRGNTAFARELLDAGVSVNGLDKAGNAPIHWACRGGHADIVKMLLSKNAAVNSQNKLGDTPLHLAAWGGHANCVQLLLERQDINADLKNKDGKRPVDIAKSDDAAALLLNFVSQTVDLGESDED